MLIAEKEYSVTKDTTNNKITAEVLWGDVYNQSLLDYMLVIVRILVKYDNNYYWNTYNNAKHTRGNSAIFIPALAADTGYSAMVGVGGHYGMFCNFSFTSDFKSPYVWFESGVNSTDFTHLSKIKYSLYGIK